MCHPEISPSQFLSLNKNWIGAMKREPTRIAINTVFEFGEFPATYKIQNEQNLNIEILTILSIA